MDIQNLEKFAEETEDGSESQGTLLKGKERVESAEKRGDWGHWAKLTADMKTANPETDLTIDKGVEEAILKTLEEKKTEAKRTGDWVPYAFLACNAKRIDSNIDIKDEDAERNILEQLDAFEKKAHETGKWRDYAVLFSQMKIINSDLCPETDDEKKTAILNDTIRSGSALDLRFAAATRIMFPELKAPDLGVDPGVENEVKNNLDNFANFQKNYDNYFELSANFRIVKAEKLEIK